jgi:putative nucleotidyltransferase with HDIG domain
MTFLIHPELVKTINSFGKLYEVGGFVRDSLIDPGIDSKDRDYLITGIPLDKLVSILKKYGRVDLVGKSFGVIKFTGKGTGDTVDIAIPRVEKSTGVEHRDFDIQYDPFLPVEDDLGRRDFTINAIARSLPDGEIIDPFSGVDDIRDRKIRIVFPNAIEDDPLRILRAVQFAARLNFSIEEETLTAMKEKGRLIQSVSPERIAEELNKMLIKADKPSIGFRYLYEIGVLETILPSLEECAGVDQPGGYHRWDVFDHTLECLDNTPKKLNVRLAALFHDVGKPKSKQIVEGGATFYGHDRLSAQMAKKNMRKLKYSNELIDQVDTLVSKHMFNDKSGDKGVRRLINAVGIDLIFDLIELRRADTLAQGMGQDPDDVNEFEKRVKEEIEKKSPFGFKDLAINGADIMKEFKLEESPEVGRVLRYLLDLVLDDPSLNTKEKLLEISYDFLSQKR